MLQSHSSRLKGFNAFTLCSEFGVKNETELYNKLVRESETIPCIICRKEITIGKIQFIDGNPYCPCCADGGDEQ